MVNVTAPRGLQSLMIGAVLASGLLFAGCNAGQISGATSDDATVQATSNSSKLTDGTTRWGDHNNDCSVDPTDC
ncbi:MAG TPA: hypothetical protein VFG50_02375 [Rhodothermales bacterium]|nr:hypothetical protein [Rhodothermales bacterium]